MSRLKGRSRPVVEKVAQRAAPLVAGPWRPTVGHWCSFYYEGGHGERYWSGGWHCGVIREIPVKGQHKNWVRIELMVDHYAVEEDPRTHERIRRIIPHEKAWVFGANVNKLGDTTYHGPRLHEVVQERQEAKQQDQELAEAAKVGATRRRRLRQADSDLSGPSCPQSPRSKRGPRLSKPDSPAPRARPPHPTLSTAVADSASRQTSPQPRKSQKTGLRGARPLAATAVQPSRGGSVQKRKPKLRRKAA